MREAREVIATIVSETRPEESKAERFRELSQGVLEEQPLTRLFEVTSAASPIQEPLTQATQSLWTEELILRVRYEMGGAPSTKLIRYKMESDARLIIAGLQAATAQWCPVLYNLRAGHRSLPEEPIMGLGGRVGTVLNIPITIQFFA